jgi:phosphoglycolate phosphatase
VLFDKDGTLIDLHASWVGAGRVLGQRLCATAGRPWELSALLEESGYDPVSGRLDPEGSWASGTTESLVRNWIARLGLEGGEALVTEMLTLMTDEANKGIVPLADLREEFSRVAASGRKVGVATMDLEASARVMVVGDTPHDMHMARQAGAGLVVGVTSGAGSGSLLAGIADCVVSDVSAAVELLFPV